MMLKKIIFIISSIILVLSCEDSNNQNCELYENRGNLISYELISEFTEGAFKVNLIFKTVLRFIK